MKPNRKAKTVTGRDNDLLLNGSGYVDPTAYKAIKKVDAELDAESWRFHGLLDIIRDICELADFELEGRIVVRDKRTGKVWR